MSEEKQNVSVLFVCLGNICRSPTAEAVFRHKDAEKGLAAKIDLAGSQEVIHFAEGEKVNVKIIACITDVRVFNKILSHLDKQSLFRANNEPFTPPLRAPPDIGTFSDYTMQCDFDFGA